MDQRPKLKPETLKVLEENTGSTLCFVGIGRDFLNRTLFAQELRPAIEKKNFMKLVSAQQNKEGADRMGKNFCQLYIWKRTNIQNL